MALHEGDIVEVRSKREILASLDKYGRLEDLPFMPQMFQYCGKRFRVFKRAHKTCDTVNPIAGRRISSCVHLDLRCDGKAFAGCQAGCLIFWKEAWLKPAPEKTNLRNEASEKTSSDMAAQNALCTEEDVWNATSGHDPQGTKRYFCQATQLPYYTQALPWWDLRQYVEDYSSGNVTLVRLLCGFVYILYWHIALAKRSRIGRPARWLYDQFQYLRGGIPFPRRTGIIPAGQPTPTRSLDLQPGELVRIKSYEEILATLDTRTTHRGMIFDAEMVPFCGKTYRVRTRVDNFVNEKTGRIANLKTPAVILEDVWCQARYSNCRMFCPRSIFPWWREVWLDRIGESDHANNDRSIDHKLYRDV